MNIPLKDQLAELRREARYRRAAYPRFVARGTLTQEDANRREIRLAAAILTLQRLVEREEEPSLPL